MIPMNLGQRGLRVGLPEILAQQQRQPHQRANPTPEQSNQARDYGVAQALSQPIQVQSGGWGEALAEAVASGLQGRIARRDRQHELDALAGEQKQESAQRNAISDALANFDPSQPNRLVEGLRTAAPEQALDLATALARREPEQPEYQIDDAGRPYTIQNGQVQYGQGQVYRRPPQSSTQQAPSGYRFTPEGDLQPIPGGPADLRQTQEGRSRAAQMESSARQLDNALAVIDEAMPNVNGGNSGFWGGLTRGVPGSSAYDLNQQLEPLRAILSFESLAEMRRNSQTGGALGSIAVRELELLGNTVRSLDTAQSEEQLTRALAATRAQLARTRQAIAAAQSELGGAPQASPQGQQQQPVLRWNPQTGQLE